MTTFSSKECIPKAESAEMEMKMIENSEDWQLQSPGSVCKIQVEKEEKP
jgi:hypothetical protein